LCTRKKGNYMKKLRQEFWDTSKSLIEWCGDEELRVLRQMAAKEMESRLQEQTRKLDDTMTRAAKGRKKAVKARSKAKQNGSN